jgi:hypothetical protein
MKLFISLKLTLILFFLAAEALAFMPQGKINNSFRYRNFERDGDGYSFTLENTKNRSFSEFYVVVLGLDIMDRTVYRHRFYVEFIGGKKEIDEFLPGYNPDMKKVRFKLFQNPEVDTR